MCDKMTDRIVERMLEETKAQKKETIIINGTQMERIHDGKCATCPLFEQPKPGQKYGRCESINDPVNPEWICAEFVEAREPLKVYDGVVYEDEFHITGKKAKVVLLEDVTGETDGN